MAEIEAFLGELSSSSPAPGGGSAAALQTALGAALIAMVGNLTIGKKRYASVEGRARAAVSRAAELRDRAWWLAGEDRDAYAGVAAALRLPRETEHEKSERRAQLQDSLKRAAEPPREIMQVAADVMALAREILEFGNRAAISDVGCGALAAHAGFESARLNVEINLAGVTDAAWVAATRRRMEQLPDVSAWEAEVLSSVRKAIGATTA